MVKKTKDVEISSTINIVIDYPVYQEFKKLVGSQNASKEIRAMIKERVLALQSEKLQSAKSELSNTHNKKDSGHNNTNSKIDVRSGSYEPESNYIRNSLVFETSVNEICTELIGGIKAI